MSSLQPRERIAVIGAGYVGLVSAVGFASMGYDVDIVEIRADRREMITAGRAPFHEPMLADRLAKAVNAGRLHPRTAVPDGFAGIVLVCVGTPIGDDGRSDLAQLRTAMSDLSFRLHPDAVVVIRSTLPIGTSREVATWLGGTATSRVFLNPEFLRQGSAVNDFERPTRVVIGRFDAADPKAQRRVEALYDGLDAEVFVVDATAAEMIKNGANAFLALRLSFVNEIAALCEEAGTDVGPVLAAMGADPRIGGAYLRPSYGFGGSCLPKELLTLAIAGLGLGLPMHVTTAASTANRAQQVRFAARIAARLGGLEGRQVGVLGLAFKANTDDVRSSPALDLVRHLMRDGARVRAFDPVASANAARELPDLDIVEAPDVVFDAADVVIIATEWDQFRTLPWAALRERMHTPLIVDGRRIVDAGHLRTVGFDVMVLGDGHQANS